MDPKTRGPWTPYKKTRLKCTDKSRTKQSDKDDADVNKIMEKALRLGHLPPAEKQALYLDLSSGQDFRESMAIVLNAEKQFQALPSKIRSEFHNDPALFLEFASDPANSDRMIELGLKEKPRGVYDSQTGSGSTQAASSESSNKSTQQANISSGETAQKG